MQQSHSNSNSNSNSNSKNNNSIYSASAGYNSPFANLTSSISTDSHGNNQYSVGISSGIVAHPYGITLANSLGDSFAIIHAKQGYGAKVNNSSNNTLDWFGNGIYNYLTPYTFNQVGVNINDVSPDVQFNSTQKRVIPRINSILLVNFETEYGPSTLINLTKSNGDPVPMGASVLFNDENIGMVAQDGQIYLKNIPDNSIVNVNWGNNSCYFIYNSPLETKKNLAGFYILNEVCKD